MRAENESSAAALPGHLMDLLAVCREVGGLTERFRSRGSPGGPVVKTSSSTAGGKSLIPGRGAKIPHASWPKHQIIKKRSNTVTSSIKTLKMVQVKKIYIIFKKEKRKRDTIVDDRGRFKTPANRTPLLPDPRPMWPRLPLSAGRGEGSLDKKLGRDPVRGRKIRGTEQTGSSRVRVVSVGPKPRSEESEEQSRISRMQASSRRRWELTRHPESSLALSFSLETEPGKHMRVGWMHPGFFSTIFSYFFLPSLQQQRDKTQMKLFKVYFSMVSLVLSVFPHSSRKVSTPFPAFT